MDLIYKNETLEELGVLLFYELDLDVNGEKDFELTMSTRDNVLWYGYTWFIRGTEYGGRVDKITVITKDNEIIYEGRNWRGILNSKIIQPEPGEDYRVVSGKVKEVINDLLKESGLEKLFVAVEDADTSHEVNDYQFHRYCTLYDGIISMLNEFDLNLHIEYGRDMVELSADIRNDFSDFFVYGKDNTTFFEISETRKGINHLVCMGQGNLKDRKIIHLFTDENGGIQKYAKTEEPLQDHDYVLDTSGQILFGVDEIAEAYDYPNAEITENYILIASMPERWAVVYKEYYTMDERGSYKQAESTEQEVYNTLSSQPSDWNTNFSKYWYLSGGTYHNPSGVQTEMRIKITKKPSSWNKNYKNYQEFYSDGVQSIYRSISGVSKQKYEVQTRQPTDWKINCTNYFMKEHDKKKNKTTYVAVKKTGANQSIVPGWKKNKYYTRYSYQVSPEFNKDNTYYLQTNTTSPAFSGTTYYSKDTVIVIPAWKTNTYYAKVLDHYADLVENAIKRIEESWQGQSQRVDIADMEVNIGDVVGGKDEITGLTISEQVTNIILKSENGKLTLSYEVGK